MKNFYLFESNNFPSYLLDFNYHTEYSCTSNDRDNICDPYCKCGTIVDIEILNIDFSTIDIVKDYFEEFKLIDQYCIDRILKIYNFQDPSLWEINVCSGYYGQEIESASFINMHKLADKIKEFILIEMDLDKIKFILELEYGYILDSLKKASTVAIKSSNIDYLKSSIQLNENYSNKLNKENLEYYSQKMDNNMNFDFPFFIAQEKNGQLFLIDGYHRFLSLKKKITNKKKIKYIVLS